MLNVNNNKTGQRQPYSIIFIKPILAYLKMWTFTWRFVYHLVNFNKQWFFVCRWLFCLSVTIRIFYFPNIDKVRSSKCLPYILLYILLQWSDACITIISIGYANHSETPGYHRVCRCRDRMVVGFTTTCATSAYHH